MAKDKNKGNKQNSTSRKESLLEQLAKAEQLKNDSADLKKQLTDEGITTDVPAHELSKSMSEMVDDANSKGSLESGIGLLRVVYEEMQSSLSKIKNKQTSLTEKEKILEVKQSEIAADKFALKAEREKFKAERDAFRQEKLNFETGDYDGPISKILSKVEEAEKIIDKQTTEFFSELTKGRTEFVDKLKDYEEKRSDLEKEREEFECEKKRFEIERKKSEVREKRELAKHQQELEDQFALDIETSKQRIEQYEYKISELNKQVEAYHKLRSTLMSAFPDPDKNYASEIEDLIRTKNDLIAELEDRPDIADIEQKDKLIHELQDAYDSAKKQINEHELLMLKSRLERSELLQTDLIERDQKIRCLEVREESLQKTIKNLQDTVDQLKGEQKSDQNAFEFANYFENDRRLGQEFSNPDNPESLHKFALYIQSSLANKPKNPLYYDFDTIRTFISGLFMSEISILQGISGTGKTSLPREFAIAMTAGNEAYDGMGDDKYPNAPYRICAIQSGWRDRMDLMGYYNSFEHKYRETEFFKALYLANLPKYQNTLFLIVLDEMNLSRPEHYFADFLSVLEQHEDARLVDIDGNDRVWPDKIKEARGKLRIPPNVRFIGTANHDETTVSFAPKTYDRSNLMEMPRSTVRINIAKPAKKYSVSYDWLSSRFNEALTANADCCKTFANFMETVRPDFANVGLGVGNRFDMQARKFISMFIACGAPSDTFVSLARGADHLLCTRVLRTLPDNYDLSENDLKNLRDVVVSKFEQAFGQEPKRVKTMINDLISKK